MLRQLKTWLQGKNFPEKPIDADTKDAVEIDPRELPRPLRLYSENAKIISFIQEEMSENKEPASNPDNVIPPEPVCQCHNCTVLTEEFAECPVCTEPLQSTSAKKTLGVCACSVCGNVCCGTCAEKITACAFCRAPLTLMELPDAVLSEKNKNVAIERLLTKLSLPCRNAKFGCPKLLTREERECHETTCNYTPTGCPLHKFCGWHGESSELINHLRDAHDLNIVPANGINIEISDLRAKLKSTVHKSRRYSISLSCHGNIYICKVILHNLNLKLSFVQVNEVHLDGLSSAAVKTETVDNRIFGAWIEVKSSMKTIKGILPISSKQNMKTLDVPCQALLSPVGRDSDLVKIAITIRNMQ